MVPAGADRRGGADGQPGAHCRPGRANLFELENFVAREVGRAPSGAAAPRAAGGNL
ncbi:putative bacterioferritin BfrB [Mycobacterium ulcerans str. Harvey]|uniref:Bacterioferritin BfrB n=1 Tax=Mycobacterium ulcerans str. Harvey TaxID=1299332 RepID=A0ABP3A1G0_MYCUL|nr:putative bacterioferritin BfrB [Mycobacterium ulcerans str. Harvey]